MSEGCGRKIGPYDCCTIITGDAKELAKAIPDESMDLVFTDPPYSRKYLNLYSWLANESSRILKSGRRCLALAGHAHLPEILKLMSESLDWSWLISQFQGHLTSPIFPERIWANWKPCVVFRKGALDGHGNFAMDCFRDTPAALELSKSFHSWGQGAPFFAYYISRWTMPKDIVCDPLAGGGTVLAVCKMLGRHYLAFEIDPETAERARERVRNTQPPLFVMEPEQLEFAQITDET